MTESNHNRASGDANPPSSTPQAQQALRDIDFIKQLVARHRRKLPSAAPYLLLWGAYLMIGFVGMQFDEATWPIWYWGCGALVAGVLSAWFGLRQRRDSPGKLQQGQDGASGWTFGLPFLILMLAGGFMMASGIVEMAYAAPFWCLMIGTAYVFLGALIGRGSVLLGLWFVLLAILTRLFLMDWQYLVLGLLGGGSIFMTGWVLLGRSRRHG